MRRMILLTALALSSVAAGQQPGSPEDKFLLAVRKGDAATVKAMLAAGFNPNTKYRYDRMPLSFACDRGNIEVVGALLDAGADISAADSFYKITALEWALEKKHTAVVALLLERGAPNSERVLTTGVNAGSLELVKISLAKGGLQAESLMVALSLAQRSSHREIVDALKSAGAQAPALIDTELLSRYAGTYRPESGQGQDFTFTNRGGRLEGGPQGQTFALLPLDTVTFRPEQFGGVTIRFNVDENGKVTGAVLKEESRETIFKRVGADAKP